MFGACLLKLMLMFNKQEREYEMNIDNYIGEICVEQKLKSVKSKL